MIDIEVSACELAGHAATVRGCAGEVRAAKNGISAVGAGTPMTYGPLVGPMMFPVMEGLSLSAQAMIESLARVAEEVADNLRATAEDYAAVERHNVALADQICAALDEE